MKFLYIVQYNKTLYIMRKIVALLSLIISIEIAEAQNTATTGSFTSYFTAGPKVGINITTISGANNAESKTGFVAGAFLIYSFQEHFGASLDALYSMEGAEYTESEIVGTAIVSNQVKDRLNYLRVPVMANVFFGQHGNAFRPKIVLGPTIGFLMSAERESSLTVEGGTVTSTSSTKTDVKNRYTGSDFGATIGTGFNLRMMEMTWFNFDARYYIGATDIRDIRPAGTDERKNNGLSLTAGVGFGF